MIKSLRIENFILVDKLELHFGSGLQVVTGETGAGKSIIIGAIETIFSGVIKPGMVFDETRSALLEINLDLSIKNEDLKYLLETYEVDISEGEVFFSRTIYPGNRSKVFLNGRRISNKIAEEFKFAIMDFHSQKDHQKLMDNSYQLSILDKFGNHTSHLNKFRIDYLELKEKYKKITDMLSNEKELEDRIKLYEYQVNEIETIDPVIGEDEKLQNEMNVLAHSEEIINLSANMIQTIFESENSVYDVLNSYIIKLSKFETDNQNIKNVLEYLRNSTANFDDIISELNIVQNIIEIDSSHLSGIEERLDQLNSLKLKYKKDIPGIIEHYQKIKKTLETSSSNQERIKKLQNEIDSGKELLWSEAEDLSRLRKKAAVKFEQQISKNIKKLAIPEAEFKITFDKVTVKKDLTHEMNGLTQSGQDRIEFFFTANTGVKMQPLKYAASGGEFSRVLLAIKKMLSEKIESRTIIFDEIDTGIGGQTAGIIGDYIYKIGKNHQVICITHLPQIASFADNNYVVKKVKDKKSPVIKIKKLKEDEIKKEIARMLSGTKSELALKHAEEMINKTKGDKLND